MPGHFFSRFASFYDFSYISHLVRLPAFNFSNLQSLEQLSYAGIFLGVMLSGYVIPVPEELVLLVGGYLAAQHLLFLPFVMLVGLAGALAGDGVLYYLAGHGSHFAKKYHKEAEKTAHAGWYLKRLRRSPFLTIFFSRFILGMRALNPLISGLTGVRWRTFFPASALSAAIYVPFIIGLGWLFNSQISSLIAAAESLRHILLALFIVGTAVLLPVFITNLLENRK
jgi:membrane protein DedA with SNARE-associated domain